MLTHSTDPESGIGSIARAVAAVMPAEIRVFALDELEEARCWVRTG